MADDATARATEPRLSAIPSSASIKVPPASVAEELRAAVKPSGTFADRRRTSLGPPARSLFSSVIVLIIIVSIAAIWLYSRSVARNARLGLRAEKQSGNSVLVHWNGRSTAVLAAHGGVLLIEDGPFHSDLKLGSAELSNGALMYTPQSKTVRFHLNLIGAKGRSWSESAQFSNDNDLVASTPKLSPSNTMFRTVTRGVSARAPAARSSPPSVGTAVREKVERRSKAVSLSAQRTTTMPAPLVQAVPQAEVMPQLIPGSAVLEPVKVRVSVAIDATGKVVEADLVAEATQVDELLARAALSAAQEWVFQPATRGGQPVASKHIIEFRFHAAPAPQPY